MGGSRCCGETPGWGNGGWGMDEVALLVRVGVVLPEMARVLD